MMKTASQDVDLEVLEITRLLRRKFFRTQDSLALHHQASNYLIQITILWKHHSQLR